MSFDIGGSKSNSKSTTTLDPKLSQTLYGNLGRAQELADTTKYHTLDSEQIQSQMNPYIQNVVDATTADARKTMALDQNSVDAAARASGAFGGSRHGVQAGVTAANGEDNLNALIARLRSEGFTQAQGVAQAENANENNLPLALQALLNQTVSTIPQTGTTKGSGSTLSASGSFKYGGG